MRGPYNKSVKLIVLTPFQKVSKEGSVVMYILVLQSTKFGAYIFQVLTLCKCGLFQSSM